MKEEKVLTPEEEKLIANISGEEIEKAVEILDSAEVKSTMIADEDGIHNLKAAHQEQHEENMSKVIEDASEVLVEGTKEDKLGADMVKLAGIDSQLNGIKIEQKTIQTIIDEYLKTQGLFSTAEKLKTEATSLRKDYGLLKTDIGERALANYKKTGEKNPAKGLKIGMYKNREFEVDETKAIPWLIADEKMHVFLTIKRDSYADQLALGTFLDMPGKVDDSKIPKATISIKPYQKKE